MQILPDAEEDLTPLQMLSTSSVRHTWKLKTKGYFYLGYCALLVQNSNTNLKRRGLSSILCLQSHTS